jgi:hypothetical protein
MTCNTVISLQDDMELRDLDYAPARFEDYPPCREESELSIAMVEFPDNFFPSTSQEAWEVAA